MSSRKSQWSNWQWEDRKGGRWYRWRTKHGRIEHEYSYPQGEAQPEEIPRTPVPEEDVEQLADSVDHLGLNTEAQEEDAPEDPGGSYQDDDPTYTLGPSGGGGSGHKGKGKAKSRHGRGNKIVSEQEYDQIISEEPFFSKAQVYGDQENWPHGGHATAYDSAQISPSEARLTPESDEEATAQDHTRSKARGKGKEAEELYDAAELDPYVEQDRRVRFGDPEDDEDSDPELQAAIEASTRTAYAESRPGQSSTSQSAYDAPEVGYAGQVATAANVDAYAQASDDSGVIVEQDDFEDIEPDEPDLQPERPASPRPLPYMNHIAGTEGDYEPLDPRYQVHPSSSFQPGWVFKVLWSEPKGHDLKKFTEKQPFKDENDQVFYVGFRRFIIIAGDQGHCTCVPILTYGRKGCTKKGVKSQHHGIIYQHGKKPVTIKYEPRFRFEPIRMRMTEKDEQLARESRVNYSKLTTIEHNVKVYFIGYLEKRDYNIATAAVNQCWIEKDFATSAHH